MATVIDGSASVTINSGAVLGITSGTAVATTSGTSIDFTGLPAWVKRITVMLSGVSTNGTSNLVFQLGDSGGIENTGYTATGIDINSTIGVIYTTGFGIGNNQNATNPISGSATFLLSNSANNWVCNGACSDTNTRVWVFTGNKTTSATLDQVRITTVGGINTFDAGSVNILYEG
jgi:hypothetical protein